jgi:short-subunit dehydrogenase
MDISGKVAAITGASSGIGLSLAQQLLDAGVKVYGLSRNKPNLEHENFTFIKTNVRDSDSVDFAFSQIGGKVNFLINNAGLGKFKYLEKTSVEEWKEMFETNVNGVFYCTRNVVEGMKTQGSGHIVNIASTAGLEGYPQAVAYCGTKFAVKGISQSLYKEVRDYGVKVTCVYPGSVKTAFFKDHPGIEPHDNMLDPEEVAKMIVDALKSSSTFHQVNLEVRPLQPKGPRVWGN